MEHNMTSNSKRLNETMAGDIRSFAKQMRRDLIQAGFSVVSYKEASISEETKRKVHQNSDVACIVVKEAHSSVDRLEVYVNQSKELELKKIVEGYNTVEGTYGPHVLSEWFCNNVSYAAPNGIYRSKVSNVNPTLNITQVTYNSIR